MQREVKNKKRRSHTTRDTTVSLNTLEWVVKGGKYWDIVQNPLIV